ERAVQTKLECGGAFSRGRHERLDPATKPRSSSQPTHKRRQHGAGGRHRVPHEQRQQPCPCNFVHERRGARCGVEEYEGVTPGKHGESLKLETRNWELESKFKSFQPTFQFLVSSF